MAKTQIETRDTFELAHFRFGQFDAKGREFGAQVQTCEPHPPQQESNMAKTAPYFAGYEAMIEQIKAIGWDAARDAFNLANPPGQKWTGSHDGLAYANGEFQALADKA